MESRVDYLVTPRKNRSTLDLRMIADVEHKNAINNPKHFFEHTT